MGASGALPAVLFGGSVHRSCSALESPPPASTMAFRFFFRTLALSAVCVVVSRASLLVGPLQQRWMDVKVVLDTARVQLWQPPRSVGASATPPPLSPAHVDQTVTFPGCGGLYTYLFGVAAYMQRNFDLSRCAFASASAGAFPAYLLAAELDVEAFHHTANRELIESVRAAPAVPRVLSRAEATGRLDPLWTWNDAVRDQFLAAITSRLGLEQACSVAQHRHFVSMTELPTMENHLVSEFLDAEDLVDAFIASAFVPIYASGGALTERFRGRTFVDGGLSDNAPEPFDDVPSLVISPYRWRAHEGDGFPFVRADFDWADRKFREGLEDAAAHHDELAAVLPLKSQVPGGIGDTERSAA